ncbi:MAG TPA: hypothetical protein PLP11_07390, partial [Bacteroidales bacterium]|nr:hypothetical protein [Bacteroidales bacterium]
LQAIGRYSRENLVNLGDLAAASGKPLEQVMSAYAKLATGQRGEAVNMFRDLLISSEDWAKATGKGIKANGEMVASTEEMIAALPAILKAKGFIGMMGEQSKTTAGQLSNLKDSAFQLQAAFGENMQRDVKQLVYEGSGLLDVVKEWVEIPTAQKIASEKAELNYLVTAITDTNTEEGARRDLIADLQSKYPDFLGSINAETVSNEELRKKLAEVNEQYEAKMRLAAMQEVRSDEEKRLERLEKERAIEVARIEGAKMMSQYEKDLAKYIPADDPNNYMGQDFTLDQKIEGKYREMERRIKANPNDTEALKYMENYYNYKAAYELSRGMGSAESNVAEYDTEIKQLRTVVGMLNTNVSALERDQLVKDAQMLDIASDRTYNKMFGSKDYQQSKSLSGEFDKLRSKPVDTYTDADWQRLSMFMSGELRYSPPMVPSGPAGGGSGNRLQKAEDEISGGGRNMKVVNITLDSLISTVNNVFEPGQDPAGANDFLDKLSRALTMVVNDVNYMP